MDRTEEVFLAVAVRPVPVGMSGSAVIDGLHRGIPCVVAADWRSASAIHQAIQDNGGEPVLASAPLWAILFGRMRFPHPHPYRKDGAA